MQKKSSLPIMRAGLLLAPAVFCLTLLVHQKSARAGGIDELDSKTRRAIRDAQMERYGSGKKASSSSVPGADGGSGVVVNDSTGAAGKKKCTVQVGGVVTSQSVKGARQESITYVDGNVINVCE